MCRYLSRGVLADIRTILLSFSRFGNVVKHTLASHQSSLSRGLVTQRSIIDKGTIHTLVKEVLCSPECSSCLWKSLEHLRKKVKQIPGNPWKVLWKSWKKTGKTWTRVVLWKTFHILPELKKKLWNFPDQLFCGFTEFLVFSWIFQITRKY